MRNLNQSSDLNLIGEVQGGYITTLGFDIDSFKDGVLGNDVTCCDVSDYVNLPRSHENKGMC